MTIWAPRLCHRTSATYRSNHPGHQLRRAPGGRRRQPAERLDQLENVPVVEAAQQVDEPKDGRVGDLAEEPKPALQFAWLELRHDPHRAIEQADEGEEGTQPV